MLRYRLEQELADPAGDELNFAAEGRPPFAVIIHQPHVHLMCAWNHRQVGQAINGAFLAQAARLERLLIDDRPVQHQPQTYRVALTTQHLGSVDVIW